MFITLENGADCVHHASIVPLFEDVEIVQSGIVRLGMGAICKSTEKSTKARRTRSFSVKIFVSFVSSWLLYSAKSFVIRDQSNAA
jgi:hypothetical protein